jgi:hypothetical protein
MSYNLKIATNQSLSRGEGFRERLPFSFHNLVLYFWCIAFHFLPARHYVGKCENSN